MIETNLGEPRASSACWSTLADTCAVAEHHEWLLPVALAGPGGVVAPAWGNGRRFACRVTVPDPPGGLLAHWSAASRLTVSEAHRRSPQGGRDDIAREVLREAAEDVRRLGMPLAESHLLSMIAVVEQLRSRPQRAGRLLAAARHVDGAANLPIPFRTPASWALYRHYLPVVRAALGPEGAQRAREDGRAMTLDDALAYALEGLD